jgi:hypothetical protein
MIRAVPAHKVVGDVGKPGQVKSPSQPVPPVSDPDAWRLRWMYDCLFYNPMDSGV